MRIIHTESSWGWGGQEIRILTEAQAFINEGHQVFVLCDKEANIFKKAPSYGVPTIACHLKKKRLRDLLGLGSAIARHSPELVVCHSSTDHWLTAIFRLLTPYSFTIVRARHVSAKINNLPTTRWLYTKGCEGVLTTSTSIKSAMIRQKLGTSENIRCIPTGFKVPGILPSRKDARRVLSVSDNSFVISIVATLRSWKGHADLLRGFKDAHLLDAVVLIAGDGPQRALLEDLSVNLGISKNTIFLGQLDNVYPVLAASDLFALPSYANEGIPQAILQARSLGLPILSCPVGGIPEALASYPLKTLVSPKDPDQITVALKRLYKECRSGANERVSRKITTDNMFTIQEMFDNCIDFYSRSLRKRGY